MDAGLDLLPEPWTVPMEMAACFYRSIGTAMQLVERLP